MSLSCRQVVHLLSQRQDRKLSLSEKLSLRLHLLICRGCRSTDAHFTFLRTTARRIGSPDIN